MLVHDLLSYCLVPGDDRVHQYLLWSETKRCPATTRLGRHSRRRTAPLLTAVGRHCTCELWKYAGGSSRACTKTLLSQHLLHSALGIKNSRQGLQQLISCREQRGGWLGNTSCECPHTSHFCSCGNGSAALGAASATMRTAKDCWPNAVGRTPAAVTCCKWNTGPRGA